MTSDPQVPPPLPESEPPSVVEPAVPVRAEKAATPVARVPFTKVAGAWWALIVGSLVLIVLLVFIGQNLHSTTIHFLGWEWETRVGIGMLVAVILGSLLTVLVGTARMVQLRRVAKKNLR